MNVQLIVRVQGSGTRQVVGLVFTIFQVTSTQRTAQHQLQLAEDQQLDDRFSRAVENLSNGDLSVRLGGVYALAEIARDTRCRQRALAVLAVYAGHNADKVVPKGRAQDPQPDIRAALIAGCASGGGPPFTDLLQLSGRALPGIRLAQCNLAGVDLRGANLAGADLNHADLNMADLGRINLTDANLRGARLSSSDRFHTGNLTGANLAGADLSEAHLAASDLNGADLSHTNLSHADLTYANLDGAKLTGEVDVEKDRGLLIYPKTDLTGARLWNATFRKAKMAGVDLTEVDLAQVDFTGTDLTKPASTDDLGW
jgi:uncharacterized protein YjbI with pentapeptide repeats